MKKKSLQNLNTILILVVGFLIFHLSHPTNALENKLVPGMGMDDTTIQVRINWHKHFFPKMATWEDRCRVVAGKDTSDFVVSLFVDRQLYRSEIIEVNMSYEGITKPYLQRMTEIRLILANESKRWDLGNLKTIRMGRLIDQGELCLTVSRAYGEVFGFQTKKPDRKRFQQFLNQSRIVMDFNRLLLPYGLEVRRVCYKKLLFADPELYQNRPMNRIDSSMIPEKLVDFIAYLKIKKIKK